MKKSLEYEEEINNTDSKFTQESKVDIGKYIFRVEDDNYRLDKDIFNILYPYIKNVKHSFLENKLKIYLLPRIVDKEAFELFLNILEFNNEYHIDTNKALKLVNVADYFKYTPLLEKIIKNILIPSLDKNSCLRVIKDYTKKLYDPITKPLFLNLLQDAIDIAASNIFYLINNKSQDLLAIGLDPLEEIIENYFETSLFNTNIDNLMVMKMLIKARKLGNIFDLLENERKRAIGIFEKLSSENDPKPLEPSIIWNISCDSPSSGFYKESEEFQYERISLVLINYYDSVKDICSIAIKIKDISINTTDHLSSHNNTLEKAQFIISLLSICEIKEIGMKTRINFNCIFSNLKTKVLMCKIENFSQKFKSFESVTYNLLIYFSLSYNFSMILTHICRSFYEYYSLPSIGNLSKNVFSIILKYDSLNVRSEDEILEAVKNWIIIKNGENICEIIKCIKWNLISVDSLLDFILSESKYILSNQELQSNVIGEFQRRFKEEFKSVYIEDKSSSNKQTLQGNKKSSDFNSNNNINTSHNNTEINKKSFTSDFILKLLSKKPIILYYLEIASKFDINKLQENSISGNNSNLTKTASHISHKITNSTNVRKLEFNSSGSNYSATGNNNKFWKINTNYNNTQSNFPTEKCEEINIKSTRSKNNDSLHYHYNCLGNKKNKSKSSRKDQLNNSSLSVNKNKKSSVDKKTLSKQNSALLSNLFNGNNKNKKTPSNQVNLFQTMLLGNNINFTKIKNNDKVKLEDIADKINLTSIKNYTQIHSNVISKPAVVNTFNYNYMKNNTSIKKTSTYKNNSDIARAKSAINDRRK